MFVRPGVGVVSRFTEKNLYEMQLGGVVGG
jgi:hypothetical protein